VELKTWVQAERSRRGWTQQELADKAGLDRVEINALENGRNKGSSSRIRDGLAKAFGIRAERVGGAELPEPTSDAEDTPHLMNRPGYAKAEKEARAGPGGAVPEWAYVKARRRRNVTTPDPITAEFVAAQAMDEWRWTPDAEKLERDGRKLASEAQALRTRAENQHAKTLAAKPPDNDAPKGRRKK
jgi:transcriptional regulator with XRE-family HTH domain